MSLQSSTGIKRYILPVNIKIITPMDSILDIILGILKIVPAGPAPDNGGTPLPTFVVVLEVDGDMTGVLADADARFVSGGSWIAAILRCYFLKLNRGAWDRGRWPESLFLSQAL
jgi:hypothetical protein